MIISSLGVGSTPASKIRVICSPSLIKRVQGAYYYSLSPGALNQHNSSKDHGHSQQHKFDVFKDLGPVFDNQKATYKGQKDGKHG